MKKIKIAQIGVGHDHATFIFDSILRLQNIFEMKGFCVCEQEEQAYEPHKDTIYACAPKCSLEDILNDPELDAVVIETREALLVKYAGLAIEHGLHVHMDKPGCADPAEFDDLMLRAKEKRLTMSLGYMYRYNPAVIIAGDVNSKVYLVAKGIITDVSTNEVTGCTVTEDLGDGFTAVYGQLKELNFGVGDEVEGGQVIGYVGKSGIASGYHLHLGISYNGAYVNPCAYVALG